MIEKLVHHIQNDNKDVRGVYDSVIGNLPSKEKRWIVDIDKEELDRKDRIVSKIYRLDPVGNKLIAEIPTKSGIHLITTPFRKDYFQTWCKEKQISLDILTQNPTVLYVGNSLMTK